MSQSQYTVYRYIYTYTVAKWFRSVKKKVHNTLKKALSTLQTLQRENTPYLNHEQIWRLSNNDQFRHRCS